MALERVGPSVSVARMIVVRVSQGRMRRVVRHRRSPSRAHPSVAITFMEGACAHEAEAPFAPVRSATQLQSRSGWRL